MQVCVISPRLLNYSKYLENFIHKLLLLVKGLIVFSNIIVLSGNPSTSLESE